MKSEQAELDSLRNLLERLFERFEEKADTSGWFFSDETAFALVDDTTTELLDEVAEYLYRGEATALEE